MVHSVDGLKGTLLSQISSCSMRGKHLPWIGPSTILRQEKGQSGETETSKRRSIPSRKTDRLPDLRLLPGYWRQWIRIWICRLICSCYSKRRYSGIRYAMGRDFICLGNLLIPIWPLLWGSCLACPSWWWAPIVRSHNFSAWTSSCRWDQKPRCQSRVCTPDVLLHQIVCSILVLLGLMLLFVHETSFGLLFLLPFRR